MFCEHNNNSIPYAHMKAVLETLHISPAVYGLRVAYIVLHTFLPVVSALGFVAAKVLVFDPWSYFFIALSVISVMFFLSLRFTEMPNRVSSMVWLFVYPALFLVLSQFVYNENWKVNLAYLAAQELFSVTLLGVFLWWHEHRQPASTDKTLQGFIAVLLVCNVLSIAALVASAYRMQQTTDGSTSSLLLGGILLYMVVSAVLEARAGARRVVNP